MKLLIEIDDFTLNECKNAKLNEYTQGPIFHALKCIANGKPLDDVLDEITAEIDAESVKSFKYPNWERAKALEWAMAVIDRYKEGESK